MSAVTVDLSFQTLDELPGKLRSATAVGPIVPLQMTADMALQLATRLDNAGRMQIENDDLRRLADDILAKKAEFDVSSDALMGAIAQMGRRVSLVGLLSFGLGFVLALGLRAAGVF